MGQGDLTDRARKKEGVEDHERVNEPGKEEAQKNQNEGTEDQGRMEAAQSTPL